MRLLASALLAAFCALAPISPAHAGRDYCAYGRQSSLFLIDRTTRYSGDDQDVIVESLSAIVEDLGPGDRIRVATIGQHYSASRTLFDECRPGCPITNNPLGDLATGCASLVATSDRRGFMRRLRGAVRPLLRSAEDAPHSDITGTLAQATRFPSGGRAYAHVFIYSDMLENSQALPWTAFRNMGPDEALSVVNHFNLAPQVANANIRIVGFGRLHDSARSPLPAELDFRLRTFWQGYFALGRARSVSFEGVIAPD